jgi:hypothetical protein
VREHSAEMPKLAFPPNSDLKQGFTVSQVAEKHGWCESLVWDLRLDQKNDAAKCKELQWGIRTWDNWYCMDCLPREIHVNDSRADFTETIKDSVMNSTAEFRLNSWHTSFISSHGRTILYLIQWPAEVLWQRHKGDHKCGRWFQSNLIFYGFFI